MNRNLQHERFAPYVIATARGGCASMAPFLPVGVHQHRGAQSMKLNSLLLMLTFGIFCGGYISNTLFDSALDAAESYFHLQTTAYKTDASGYIICGLEKPKVTLAAGGN